MKVKFTNWGEGVYTIATTFSLDKDKFTELQRRTISRGILISFRKQFAKGGNSE